MSNIKAATRGNRPVPDHVGMISILTINSNVCQFECNGEIYQAHKKYSMLLIHAIQTNNTELLENFKNPNVIAVDEHCIGRGFANLNSMVLTEPTKVLNEPFYRQLEKRSKRK